MREETLRFLEFLDGLAEAERREQFDAIKDRFCLHCGTMETDSLRWCQCQNDE